MLGLESTMAVNFLYGRPALEPSHSTIGFGGTNGNTNQCPSIGFYYEDDTSYEQHNTNTNNKNTKCMYISSDNTNNNNNSLKAITTASNHQG